MKAPSTRYANLDGIRFFGALLVFFFHATTLHREIWGDFYTESGSMFETLTQLVVKAFSLGHIGVNLFFVLSGFLLTSLMLRELETTGKINVVHFLMRRTLRLWPLYFVILIFGFFVFPILPYGIETVHELWRYTLFLSNIDEILVGMNDRINFLTATWSISVEEQFYLGWSVLLILFGFKSKRWFLYFFIAIILGTLTFRFFNLNHERTLYYHTFSVLSDFAVGGLGALLIYWKSFVRKVEEMGLLQQFLCYIFIAAIVVGSEVALKGNLVVIQRLMMSIGFLSFILIQVLAKRVLLPFDAFPLIRAAGKRTYGFYLFHCIVIYYMAMFMKENNWTNSAFYFWGYVFISLVFTTALAFLSYRFFEEPILKLKRFFA